MGGGWLGGWLGWLAGLADDDVAEAGLQIGEVGGQAENRHDLGRHGDVEAVLAGKTVADTTQGVGDLAQRPVIHIQSPAPGDAALVEVEFIAPIDVIIDQRGEQIVGRSDGVDIAGEMEIDVLHGHDLGVAATGGAALDPETRSQAGLAQAHHGLLADGVKTVAEADRGGSLTLAGRSWGNRGNQDQLTVRLIGQGLDVVE